MNNNNNSLTMVQVYLEAKTKKGLIKRMVEMNTKYKLQFQYSPPMKDGNGWVVWFMADIFDIGITLDSLN